MNRYALPAAALAALLFSAAPASAGDAGLFRTVPVETPKRGILRISNGCYYSKIEVNSVLADQYRVERARIFTSVTDFELGMTDALVLTVAVPYEADLFSQAGKNGHKAGGGDVSAGFRYSFGSSDGPWDRVSLGARFLIPEKFGYGREPLGFRTFSTGEFGWTLESSARAKTGHTDLHASLSMYRFPRAPKPAADPKDLFYDTGFGLRGIGSADATGAAPTVFQNHVTFAVNGIVSVTRNTAGVMEFSGASFIEKPTRETMLRLSPGFRLGRPGSINLGVGMDIRLRGQIPKTTFLFRLSVPTLSPHAIGRGLGVVKQPPSEERIRARNIPVAVAPFTKEDRTFLYENDLRDAFTRALGSMDVLAVTSNDRTDRALAQAALVPVKDSPQEFGVRIGSNYFLSADIFSFGAKRTARFAVPFLVSFPETDFTLSARARVTDLADGTVHELGTITATVSGKRGVILFPTGKSSDIVPLSAPETRRLERELIDRWVESFNSRVVERFDLFDWNPKRTPPLGAGSGG